MSNCQPDCRHVHSVSTTALFFQNMSWKLYMCLRRCSIVSHKTCKCLHGYMQHSLHLHIKFRCNIELMTVLDEIRWTWNWAACSLCMSFVANNPQIALKMIFKRQLPQGLPWDVHEFELHVVIHILLLICSSMHAQNSSKAYAARESSPRSAQCAIFHCCAMLLD